MTSYGSYIVETLVTLVAVSALAFALLYGARQAGVGRAGVGGGAVDLVARVAIDSRRSVVLVRVGTLVYVLGVSEAGLTKLGEVAAADLPPRVDPPPAPFADILRIATGRRAAKPAESTPPAGAGES